MIGNLLNFRQGLLLALFIVGSICAEASWTMTTCNSDSGDQMQAVLRFQDSHLFSIAAGPLTGGQPFPERLVTLMSVQNQTGSTLYQAVGSSDLIILENSVIQGQRGNLEVGPYRYSCDAQ